MNKGEQLQAELKKLESEKICEKFQMHIRMFGENLQNCFNLNLKSTCGIIEDMKEKVWKYSIEYFEDGYVVDITIDKKASLDYGLHMGLDLKTINKWLKQEQNE